MLFNLSIAVNLSQVGISHHLNRWDREDVTSLVEWSTCIFLVATLALPTVGDVQAAKLIVTNEIGAAYTLEIEFAGTLVKYVLQCEISLLTGMCTATELFPLICISASAALR